MQADNNIERGHRENVAERNQKFLIMWRPKQIKLKTQCANKCQKELFRLSPDDIQIVPSRTTFMEYSKEISGLQTEHNVCSNWSNNNNNRD